MPEQASDNRDILAFCHIIKTAGTSYTDLLKDNFGPSHLNVEPHQSNEIYTLRELERDLRYMPWLKSLAGHGLRPYVDYGQFNHRLKWITWFRDPVARLISGYQHGVEKNGLKTPFRTWLQEPGHRNLHVYFLTGDTDDLQGAKEILISKDIFVGFVEQFDQSLVRLQNQFPAHQLDMHYTKRSNTAISANTAKNIYQNIDQYKDLIHENTGLDVELYQWALERRIQLDKSINETQSAPSGSSGDIHKNKISRKANFWTSTLIRQLLYKPMLSKI